MKTRSLGGLRDLFIHSMKAQALFTVSATITYFLLITGNGMMDFQEFVNLMLTKNQNGMELCEAKEAFRIFDRDDRGFILTSELRQASRRWKRTSLKASWTRF